MDPDRYLICITGPTASGKTDLAIDLAKHYNTEIISADSRQFYKEISIGTAKPDAGQLSEVPHHFVSFLSIHDEYNAAQYESDALQKIDELFREKEVLILAGGSGLFVQAVLEGFDDLPAKNEETRHYLERHLEEKGIVHLQEMLQDLDPDYYRKVDLQNPHRLIRALEVCLVTGKPYSTLLKNQKKSRAFKTIKIGLNTQRDILYNRINRRVDKMMEEGLLDEARTVFQFRDLAALQTVGYKELFEHFAGESTLEQAVEMIKQNTRRFAKRQLTWFRRDSDIEWFEPGDTADVIKHVESNIGS